MSVEHASQWTHAVAGILVAASEQVGRPVPGALAGLLHGIEVSSSHREAAAALLNGSRRAIWLGALAQRHPAYADLRALAAALAELCGATLGVLAEGGNAAGLWLAGAVPHRGWGGRALSGASGLDARGMLETPQRAYLCVGAIEPDQDLAYAALAERALAQAACVVAVTPYASESIRRHAHVILPMAAFAETSGTFVNLEGRWQSQTGAARAPGEARPGWKILRVLGNVMGLDGFDADSSEQIRNAVAVLSTHGWGEGVAEHVRTTHLPAIAAVAGAAELEIDVLDVPMYSLDAVLRRSEALQQTTIAQGGRS